MCGIAGQIGVETASMPMVDWDAVYDAMEESMGHRGPDQRGRYEGGGALLLHTRLCVVDIEGGRQPMVHRAGEREYALVYNGELYNTAELRRELEGRGHAFAGHSDTEVVLHAYMEWGEGCLDRFNGIFAFAVWELHRRRLFMARDRIGVKPFFFRQLPGGLVFASELKTLLCHPLVPPEMDREGLAEILLIGPGRTPGCGVFRGVEELLAGEWARYDLDSRRLERRIYWRLEDHPHTDTFPQTVEKVRALVLDTVRRQLVSDVPVGTFLSGGLDSSILSALADRHFAQQGGQLHTFSVDYRDNDRYFTASKFQPNSDSAYIQRMNRFLSARHHLVVLDTPELTDALFAAVEARDLPGMADVDASLLLFCRQIKQTVTVALSGECADEIFGGYPWYRDREIRESAGFPWAQSTAYRAGFVRPGLLGELDPAEYVDARYRQTVEDSSVLPGTSPLEARMRQMTNLNFRWFMQTLLDRKDRMSMYSGLEVRVPFCDWRIAQYLYTVPWEYKDYQGVEKGLLRHAMEGLLPEQVLWRKKSPYPKTHHPAYLQAVRELLRQVLADPDAPLLQFVRRDAMEALLTASNPVPWYGQLMTTPQTIAYLLQFNYWLKKYRVRYV